jgi:phosphate uptake regulator
MARKVKVRQVRKTLYVSIPKRFVEQLRLSAGDVLQVSVTRDGLLLSPYDRDVERAIKAYERMYRRYRSELRALPW